MKQLLLEIPKDGILHVIGHCFGGKYALREAKEGFLTSALAVHPVSAGRGKSEALNAGTNTDMVLPI